MDFVGRAPDLQGEFMVLECLLLNLGPSTYSKFLPETEDTTSYFSFYDVTEKIGIVVGMLIYGFIDQITGSMRNSVLFLVIFFSVGVILLLRVPKKQEG